MDVTEHQNLKKASSTANPPLPTRPTHQAEVDTLINLLSLNEYRTNLVHFTSYSTRYYTSATSLQSAQWLESKYKSYSANRPDISVRLYPHSWLQPSVIARIEGSGPNRNEVVILGGHIDSISNGATAPGADDDASGSLAVLEVFRVLAQSGFKPSRSIEFHGYAAEEVGLRGSQDIAAAYAANKVIVASMMQLDMIGYYKPGTRPAVSITSDFTSSQLNAFVRLLVEAYSDIPAGVNTCGYGCSDHASWDKAGYLACHPFEAAMANTSPYIHRVTDVVANLDLVHANEFLKVAVGYVVELGLFRSS